MQSIDVNKLSKYSAEKNIAEKLSDIELEKISGQLVEEIQYDENSRVEWLDQTKEALALARQDIQKKNYPWADASNVKIPIILNACIQFNSRINPEVVQGNKIVQVSVMRPDPTEDISEIAYHQGRHMSYQLIDVVKNWVSDTDKLLMTLPLLGTVYRKTYFDSVYKIPRVELCLPDDVIIDQSCSALEYANRITHKVTLSSNQLIERMRAGIYKKYDIDKLPTTDQDDAQDFDSENISAGTVNKINTKMHTLYECHCYLDLDEDEYEEPYIVTFHRGAKKILRIVARFNKKSWIKESGKIIGIKAKHYFTDFHFMPSLDGSFMGMGFWQFLYPMCEALNSITNNLIDAGHLANLPSGFISRALKLKMGDTNFAPGEWKSVTATGNALRESIVPIPAKEPSQTLFSLLQFLLQSARDLSSISESMQGQMPPPNTPATTVLALLQESQKVPSAVVKRTLQGFKKEFEKLYDLNSEYLKDTETYRLAKESGMVRRDQYDSEEYGVFPVADPNASSNMENLTKLQALFNIKDDPNINERAVVEEFLKLLRISDPQSFLNPPPDPNAPPPPPVKLIIAQTNNLDAQSYKLHGELMIDAEHKAHLIELDEKKIALKAAEAGIDAASKKINSTVQLAQTESLVNDQEMKRAEQAMALAERQAQLEFAPFQAMQQSQQQPQQQQQPTQQMPQQGMPQGGTGVPASPQGAPTAPQNIMPQGQQPETTPTLGELKTNTGE